MSKSIMHNKQDGTCYLCMCLNGDYDRRQNLQEHHAVPGTANRKLSEHWGLKVYLCLQHHTEGRQAVHNNSLIDGMLRKRAQEAFEAEHSHELWMREFGRNYR